MSRKSAGILAYKYVEKQLLVLLAHPGGPYWKYKDNGAWTIPKGEYENEDSLAAAKREFSEELGQEIDGSFIQLDVITTRAGKQITAFAVEADLDVSSITSNLCVVEYPYKSGRYIKIPEIDRAGWFTIEDAFLKLSKSQVPLLYSLLDILNN